MRIHRFGGPDVLQADEVEPSLPDASQVLVRVKAASINPVDFKIRNGEHQPLRRTACPARLAATRPALSRGAAPKPTNSRSVTTFSAWSAAMPKRSSLTRGRRPQASWHRIRMPPQYPWRDRLHGRDCSGMPGWGPGIVLIHGGSGGVGHVASFCEMDCRIEPHGEHSRRPNGPT